MNLRKAAEMALETLENLQGGCTDSDDGTVEAITVWCPEIIDALRESLAQPEQEPIPEGWQLVNRNMTPEQRQLMLRAEEFTVDEMWIMLLAATPKPE